MIIKPVPVISPASPFHHFMARSSTGKFRKEKVYFEYVHLASKEMEPFCRHYLVLAGGISQEGCKASKEDKINRRT